jgi:hypothetical protein
MRLLDLGVEGLDADFQLQHAGREAGDHGFQAVRQVIGDDLEMQEEVGRQAVEEELQDGQRAVDLQVEGAVDELEVARPAPVEPVQRGEEAGLLEGPGGLIQRTEAELALERAAARGFDVEQAVRQIVVGEFGVGQLDFFQRGLLAGDHFHQRLRAVQQGAAQFGEADVAPAGDQVVGEADDFLIFPFVADFRPAENDVQRRPGGFELANQFGGRRDVPDIDAEADDLRLAVERFAEFGQDCRDDFRHRPGNGEFAQDGALTQAVPAVPVEVGQQVAQAERGVDVTGVEGAEDNGSLQ